MKKETRECLFCKRPFKGTKEDQACDATTCQIKWAYLKLGMEGKDPKKYFKEKIKQGKELTCKKCKKKFKPTNTEHFFTKICNKCKKREREKIYEEVLKNPRKFLDEIE
jgi:hypothetical protein